ncbi:MAG: hypothetical protein ACE5PV_14900 [Candidatus Poribacteria bacterium]
MEILCLGIFVADVLAKPIKKMPELGKLELFDEMELHTGGCANNTAIGLEFRPALWVKSATMDSVISSFAI